MCLRSTDALGAHNSLLSLRPSEVVAQRFANLRVGPHVDKGVLPQVVHHLPELGAALGLHCKAPTHGVRHTWAVGGRKAGAAGSGKGGSKLTSKAVLFRIGMGAQHHG